MQPDHAAPLRGTQPQSTLTRRFRTLLARSRRLGALAAVAALGFAPLSPGPGRSDTSTPHESADHGVAPDHALMTEQEMAAWVRTWFEQNPRVRAVEPSRSTAGITDTLRVGSFFFDTTGDAVTDSIKILVGDSVLLQWIGGSHTVTSGIPGQPGVGALFDVPVTSAQPRDTLTFDTEGTVPFFCRPHSGSMRSVFVVSAPVGVQPVAGDGGVGFTAPPMPNPSRLAVTFRFALREAGRVRLEIVDARGRVLARPVDTTLEAGTWAAAWDRSLRTGGRAAAGVYFARLTVPGAKASERVVVVD